jgi:hypothetical protein
MVKEEVIEETKVNYEDVQVVDKARQSYPRIFTRLCRWRTKLSSSTTATNNSGADTTTDYESDIQHKHPLTDR